MTVLLRSRSLVRGIFHHHHHHHVASDEGKDGGVPPRNPNPPTPSCVISHSPTIVTLADWDDDDHDDHENDHDRIASPAADVVDDVTDIELSRRIEHSLKCGRVYDEKLGVRTIRDALTSFELSSLSDDDMPLRHYRAEKGNVDEAIRKIKNTLRWRLEFGVEDIKRCFEYVAAGGDGTSTKSRSSEEEEEHARMRDLATAIAFENETGKVYCRGYDRMGRAILYLTPGKENSNHELNNMRHLVYQLERAIECTRSKSGRSKVCIVIGYQGFRLSNAPPLSTVRHTLNILQNHYPERMHRAYICDPPLVFRTFWGVIRRLVDATTLDKIAFCAGNDGMALLERDFDVSTTEVQAGGSGKLRHFDSSEYLYDTPFDRTFDEEAKERRRAPARPLGA